MRSNLRLALVVVLAVSGCGRDAGRGRAPGTLETVDVTAQPDAAASLEGDAVARPVGAGPHAATRLPAGFPDTVPLPSPSSLVGSASTARELRVTLVIDLPQESVRSSYLRQLAAAGFEPQPDGSFGGHGHRLRFDVAADSDAAARLTVRVARP